MGHRKENNTDTVDLFRFDSVNQLISYCSIPLKTSDAFFIFILFLFTSTSVPPSITVSFVPLNSKNHSAVKGRFGKSHEMFCAELYSTISVGAVIWAKPVKDEGERIIKAKKLQHNKK